MSANLGQVFSIAIADVDGGTLLVSDAPSGTSPRGLVVLLHGAGSGTDSPVLLALATRLVDAGVVVARLEMPYRVAGRRAPDRPARMDAVLLAAVAALPQPRPLAFAGRSMGSRVACRCAREAGAVGVLALGFPLLPPGGRPSRAPELAATGTEVLVVQGARDTFGMPEPDAANGLRVHVVAGADHSFRTLKSDARSSEDATAEAVAVGAGWLLDVLGRSAFVAGRGNPEWGCGG